MPRSRGACPPRGHEPERDRRTLLRRLRGRCVARPPRASGREPPASRCASRGRSPPHGGRRTRARHLSWSRTKRATSARVIGIPRSASRAPGGSSVRSASWSLASRTTRIRCRIAGLGAARRAVGGRSLMSEAIGSQRSWVERPESRGVSSEAGDVCPLPIAASSGTTSSRVRSCATRGWTSCGSASANVAATWRSQSDSRRSSESVSGVGSPFGSSPRRCWKSLSACRRPSASSSALGET